MGDEGITHPDDLRIAEGCVAGDADAIRRFRDACLPAIDAAIRGVDKRPDFVEEARQRVLERLLVADQDRPPRIAAYTGRGSLARWAKTAAVRVALSLRDEGHRLVPLEGIAEALLEGTSPDPEVTVTKRRFAGELQAALVQGLSALPPRTRTVLRMHLFDHLNIDAIGRVYGVHRATVARWIARAREQILAEAAAYFRAAHGISPDSFSDVHAALVSELELRLSQLDAPA